MRRLIVLFCCFLTVGCASLAPERERPPLPVANAWPDAILMGQEVDALGWRDVFPDQAMQGLIATALRENRSLRQAVLAIDKARAQFGIARADRIPNVDATGRNSNTRSPADIRGGVEGIDRQWSVGLGITSFELDFFGRVKNLEESALEQYLATEEARRAAHIALVSQVASGYLALAGDREALTLARDTRVSREATLALVRSQVTHGLATELERHQAEEAVALAQAEEARLRTLVSMDENALAVLVGVPVPLLDLPAQCIADVEMGSSVASGLPSDLLVRRPDIVEAEHRLWAAGAEIGAARAAFFPRISLTSSLGLASLELNDLFDAAQRTWTFVPSLTLPIFDAGRNMAALEAAEAEQKIRLARYEEVIQIAFREVSDALVKTQGYDGQVQAQTRRVASSGQSRILVEQRFTAGLESAFAVHDAERTLFSARLDLLQARLARELTRVELFAALGGGWKESKTEDVVRSPS